MAASPSRPRRGPAHAGRYPESGAAARTRRGHFWRRSPRRAPRGARRVSSSASSPSAAVAAEAEAAFRELTAGLPDAVAPRQRLIYLLSLQQRSGEAREQLRQLARITNDPRVLVDLALQGLREQEEVRSIGPELVEFLEKTPDDPFLRRARGLALLYQGKAAEALPHLEAAADNLANDPAGRFALAECRLAVGEPLDADGILGPRPESPAGLASWWLFHNDGDGVFSGVSRPAGSLECRQACPGQDEVRVPRRLA